MDVCHLDANLKVYQLDVVHSDAIFNYRLARVLEQINNQQRQTFKAFYKLLTFIMAFA
jgi:hypothetical protein